MAGYGYGISVSSSKPSIVVSGTPAPSGIPVASTSQIIVVSTNGFIESAPFNKVNPINFASSLQEETNLEYNVDAWGFYNYGNLVAFATSPYDYIPTSGYTIIDGGGSFTLTAA
jgi:hypothetical protein